MLTLLIPPDSIEPHGLTRGACYVFEDHHAAEYLLYGWGRLVEECAHQPAGHWHTFYRENRNSVIIRSGGFGDIICLRPLLEYLWRIRDTENIDRLAVCCHPAHAAALDGLEGIEYLPYPPSVTDLKPFYWRLSLEGVIETNNEQDIVAAFGRKALPNQSTEGPEWAPTYTVPPSAVDAAWQRFPRVLPQRVGIALHSSAHCRNWPLERLAEIIHGLGTGCEVFLFGNPGPWPEIDVGADVPHLHMLPRLAGPANAQGLTLRESLALLATLDVFIGPDSGLVHAAGAMSIPTVALFGPFEARQRVARYASVRVLQGRAPCSPCYHHPRTPSQTWPAGKPCQQMHHCVAMAGITGEQVLAEVRRLIPSLHETTSLARAE